MSVQRYDINRCIGCSNCVNVCPMDVFRFNEDVQKSVIAYPENCQTCGQCYVNCLGHSLALSGEGYGYPLTSVRAASLLPMNRQLYISDTPKSRIVMPAILTVIGAMFAHTLGMGVHLGIIHRVAAVVLIGAGIYHILYVALARDGRRLLRDLAPRQKDAFDVWATMRYYFGLSQEKPKFGRFAYAEKAEYWALVVGTASMGLTGVMMWAYVWAGNLLSIWWVDVFRAIHFYEAILASLAILVWHFYQVFFDPDVFPMNWAWWDGKMPVEHYRREHELDAEWAQEGQSE